MWDWKPIETHTGGSAPVIIAVPDPGKPGTYFIGEAYRYGVHTFEGEWWWAGSSHHDEGVKSIDETIGKPTNFVELPPPPTETIMPGFYK